MHPGRKHKRWLLKFGPSCRPQHLQMYECTGANTTCAGKPDSQSLSFARGAQYNHDALLKFPQDIELFEPDTNKVVWQK